MQEDEHANQCLKQMHAMGLMDRGRGCMGTTVAVVGLQL